MKKIIVMCALFLFILLSENTCNDTFLRAGDGSPNTLTIEKCNEYKLVCAN